MLKILPQLSEYDSLNKSEGSIDPLGIYTISENLAQKMIKGVRERQKYPRFLTLIALSKFLERYFDEDDLEIVRVDPWQSFEWIVVQSFTHADLARGEKAKGLSGLPGNLKAKRLLKKKDNFNPDNYLSVPSVFGFHGIYRVLAKDIGLINDDRLQASGYELLEAWSKDQKVTGFLSGSNGYSTIRKKLLKLIRAGCVAGHACLKPKDYGDLDFLYDYLHHREIGRNESKIIWNMLVTDEDSYRDEVINFLVSEKGQKVIKKAIEQKHERLFHKELFKVASTELKSFLHAIFEYETFSRLLDDGFSEAMRELQVSASTISTQNLSQLKGFDVAHKGLKQQFLVTADALAVLEMDSQFKDTFNDVCNYESKTDLVKAIMDHHCEVQKNKGPRGTGKAPWIFPNQSGYTLNKFFKKDFIPTYDDRYVNFYRMNSLVHFAIDLGRMKDIG